MNYNFIGKCDVSEILNILNNQTKNIWLEHTIRQTQFVAHKSTNTLEILWDIDSLVTDKIGKKHENYELFNIDIFLEQIKPLYVKKYGDGEFLRILIVKLPKKTSISPHKDNGDSLESCKRTHIPIVTTETVIFTVGGENKHLGVGEIWEINNSEIHSVINDSDIDRIHFIIDFKPYFKKEKSFI